MHEQTFAKWEEGAELVGNIFSWVEVSGVNCP